MSLRPGIQHNVKSAWALIERGRRSRVVTNSKKNFWQPVTSGLSPTTYRQGQIIPHLSFFSSLAKELKRKVIWGLTIILCRSFPPFCSFPQLQLSELRRSVPAVTHSAVQAHPSSAWSCAATSWAYSYWRRSPPLRLGASTGAELGTACCWWL